MRLTMMWTIMHRGECYPQRPRRGRSWILPRVVRCEMRGNLVINAMLPLTQKSTSRWKCARKGGQEGDNGRDGASPAVCTLPMVPCGSSPVTRVSRSPLRCEKRSAWGGGFTQWVKSGWGASKNCLEKQHSPTLHKLWTLPYLHKK